MDNNTYVIIMAGGVGSRFWPFSRSSFPKQFHDVLGVGKSLLQQTADRFEGICPKENIYIVTNEGYNDLVQEQLPFLTQEQILLEPVGRNTAPCIAYAAYKIWQKDKKANLVVSPADHIILKEEVFREKVNTALAATKTDDILVTIGIQPTRPDTGYGYIQYNNSEGEADIYKVKTFTEKPVQELAEKFIESGDFVWNAGIFVWNIRSIIHAFQSYLPEIADIFRSGKDKYYTEAESNFINESYSLCKNISIDYGIMENAENVYVVLGDFGWSDLGTWKSLYDVKEKDQDNCVLNGNIKLYDSKNCMVKTPKDRLVVLEGLDGYIVAEYDNVLMVCRMDHEQQVKKFVADVKADKKKEFY